MGETRKILTADEYLAEVFAEKNFLRVSTIKVYTRLNEIDAGCSDSRHPINVTSRHANADIIQQGHYIVSCSDYIACNIFSCSVEAIFTPKNSIVTKVCI